jgi:hypothetical protein
MFKRGWIAVVFLVAAGCVSTPPAPTAPAPSPPVTAPPSPPAAPAPPTAEKPKAPHYRCDQDIAFDARFGEGRVELLFASRDPEVLLRDAGGTSPQHTVYSSTKLKAEFGLGPDGNGAKLNFAAPPIEVSCKRA